MARPKGTPGYLCHKVSGRAFVRIEGKDIYLGFHGTKESKAEYDRIISEWLANGRHLPQKENRQHVLTVDAICLSFLEHAEGYYRKNGMLTTEYKEYECVVQMLHEHCGCSPADDFGRQSLKAIREKAIELVSHHVAADTFRIAAFLFLIRHDKPRFCGPAGRITCPFK